MKVLNYHSRVINQPFEKIAQLVETLGTDNDLVWPKSLWPAMKFPDGIEVGSEGGHGPIRYVIKALDPGRKATFLFKSPEGFEGTHTLQVRRQGPLVTKLEHEINMTTHGLSTISWIFLIRPLHNALIEDAFDRVEGTFGYPGRSSWSPWVRCLRYLFKRFNKNRIR